MSKMTIYDRLRYDSNCPVEYPDCRGGMYTLWLEGGANCPECLGTGRDPIPWAELFAGKRDPRS